MKIILICKKNILTLIEIIVTNFFKNFVHLEQLFKILVYVLILLKVIPQKFV